MLAMQPNTKQDEACWGVGGVGSAGGSKVGHRSFEHDVINREASGFRGRLDCQD